MQGRDASDETVRLVVAGKQALAAVTAAMGAVPDTTMRSITCAAGQVIRVGTDKFVLSITPEYAATVWQALCQSATPVGAPVWDWLRLNAGVPMIVAATQEQFVPQMVNLEVIGGVSFQKGCYPGQEIVARSQYLGKLKRRMFLAHVDAELLQATTCIAPISKGRPPAPSSTPHPHRQADSMCWRLFRWKAPTRKPCI